MPIEHTFVLGLINKINLLYYENFSWRNNWHFGENILDSFNRFSKNKFNIQTIKISNLWGAFGIGHEEERNALTNVVLYSVDN